MKKMLLIILIFGSLWGALILVPLGYKLGKSLMTLSKARPKPALIGVADQLIREGGLSCLSKENCFG
jgi:hypothetical protein